MMDDNGGMVIRTLRAQAWERAKGELRAVAMTFYGTDGADEGQFAAYEKAVNAFIALVEDNALAE